MSLFFQIATDQTQTDVAIDNLFAGPMDSACWLIGGGPSLLSLPYAAIGKSPIPKMCINLAGSRLLRPTFWTSYDPTVRFQRSLYLDPSVMKFVHRRRSMDRVPETTYKVCECPATFFFERDPSRGFAEFLSPKHSEIVDWADSMVQAIEILYRLGFRVVYLAGCEMHVRPSEEQISRAASVGVIYQAKELLGDFLKRCEAAGLSASLLEKLKPIKHYHFDEHKPIFSASQTDRHYFQVSQYLRLCRRSMSIAGLRLVSVTPQSRLNDYFPYVEAKQALSTIAKEVGDPELERAGGLYRQTGKRTDPSWGPMWDFRPHGWRFADSPELETEQTPGPQQRVNVDDELIAEAEGFKPTGLADGSI